MATRPLFSLLVLLAALVFAGVAAAETPPRLAQADPSRPGGAATVPTVTAARLAGDGERTRLILDLTQAVPLRAFALADPYRVVVDLPQVVFALPAGTGEAGRGLVRAFRYGLVMQGGSRLVVDVTAPVSITEARVVPAAEGLPPRLVLDLQKIDREAMLRTVPTAQPPAERAQPPRAAQPAAPERPVIVIDPGHGGLDGGAAHHGVIEKDLVLGFGLMLRDKLMRSGRFSVVMTRSEDVFVPLAERVRTARQAQASLFLSLHADALEARDGQARGASVYTLSDTASDDAAARLAERENRSDILAGVDITPGDDVIADILLDLARRETQHTSAQFARRLVTELRQATRLHANPLRSGGFRVLRAPDVPSVLVELGYLSTATEARLMSSPEWRDKATDALVRAIENQFPARQAPAATGITAQPPR